MRSHYHSRSSACKSSIAVLALLSGKSLFPLSISIVFLLCVGVVFAKEDFMSPLSFSPLSHSLLPFSSLPPTYSGPPLLVSTGALLLVILHHNFFPTGLSSYLGISYISQETVFVIYLCSTKQYLC